ncbi:MULTISPECIES: Slp family lipoprotein [unclassified Thioalkalivibrio]|uniref:Slp family lipoprotein n=1 Tax=unclassified Thioalkalivibrio TaxID=2621013 RepID=UPI0026F3E8BE|nr:MULTISPECIES: Slp/YeaY family lipoprotein [unclassified Thioalkalivibrio]
MTRCSRACPAPGIPCSGRVLRLALLLIVGLGVAGCASVPERLGPLPDQRLDLATVRADVAAAAGALVVWGGVVAGVENTDDGTRLEIVARPLGRDARPRETDVSPGRFRVWVDDFLEPRDHAPGREVTVRGRIAGSEEGRIGEHVYEFVQLEAEAVHLWERRPPPQDRRYDPWYDPWYHSGMPRGYYGPGWRHPRLLHHDPYHDGHFR